MKQRQQAASSSAQSGTPVSNPQQGSKSAGKKPAQQKPDTTKEHVFRNVDGEITGRIPVRPAQKPAPKKPAPTKQESVKPTPIEEEVEALTKSMAGEDLDEEESEPEEELTPAQLRAKRLEALSKPSSSTATGMLEREK